MTAKKSKPRSYGRQGKDKTIKSLSLDLDVALWVEKEAKAKGISTSKFVNDVLSGIEPGPKARPSAKRK